MKRSVGVLTAWAAAALVAAFAAVATPRAEEPLPLVFAIHQPEQKQERAPLLVLLHGQGANELDLIGLADQLPKNFIVVSPRAPFPNPNGGFRWYVKGDEASVEASRRKVLALIDVLMTRYGVDPGRVFVGGFSQGAVMSYQLGLTEPARFRGVAVLSGSLFRSALAHLGPREAVARTPFFIGHGDRDDRIPFAAAGEARAELAKLGAAVEFHAYRGMGHGVSDGETSDLAEWLRRQAAGG